MTNPQQPNSTSASDLIISGDLKTVVKQLALPTAVNSVVITLYNIINRFFVGRLPDSDSALAAVGVGGTILMLQFSISMGLAIGSSAIVARYIGARQYQDADEAAGQGLVLSAIVGLFAGILMTACAGFFVGLIASSEFASLSTYYTAVIAASSVFLFLYTSSTSCLRSAGDVKSPLYAGLIMVVTNIVLDWILIWGIGPVPGYGVQGAAWATVISRIVGMLAGLYYMKGSILRDSFAYLIPKINWVKRTLNIGWPAILQNLMMTIPMMIYTGILKMLPAPDNTYAQAALSVAISIESVVFMPGVAYANAATPIVGQNLGAQQPDRAKKGTLICVAQAVAIMGIAGFIFLVFSEPVASFFSTSSEVVKLIASYLVVNAVSEPFLAMTMVFRGALQGAGDTRYPALITFICNFVLRLPVAWFLAVYLGYSAIGAWIAMSATTVISGLLMAGWFYTGKWRNVRV